ncbi:MAG: homoserine dehydrogenase [Clostridiales Family XIII bacterium]|jgi:homoserine dehydrogenase|nr:homoserine dehydrogenase [Clostridiales Family XIII bacterium]
MKKVNVGLLGFGNIGVGSYKVLEMNRKRIAEVSGADIEFTKILEKDVHRKRDVSVSLDRFTQDPDVILKDPSISIVVELLGGIEPASGFMLAAMKNGKHVVTANKAAVAANYDELTNTAKAGGVMFRFEASVCGGIPLLNALTTALAANEYEEILGILNGTTNYILTQMTENGLAYEEALKAAQDKGFAEADPTADVEGIDAANKLSILLSVAFGMRVPPEQIPAEGISKITKTDIDRAKAEGAKIKLIASAKKSGNGVVYSVKPTFIPEDHPLAGVGDEFNAVFVKGNAVDELMFYGKGAGPLPTGSAVIGDVVEIAKAL